MGQTYTPMRNTETGRIEMLPVGAARSFAADGTYTRPGPGDADAVAEARQAFHDDGRKGNPGGSDSDSDPVEAAVEPPAEASVAADDADASTAVDAGDVETR